MPRGYGMGRGYWRAYGEGVRRGYRDRPRAIGPDSGVPGYEYVGPCRCGWGPNAYYRTADGRILHAASVGVDSQDTGSNEQSEITVLRADNEKLAARVRELEAQLASK